MNWRWMVDGRKKDFCPSHNFRTEAVDMAKPSLLSQMNSYVCNYASERKPPIQPGSIIPVDFAKSYLRT